MLRKILIVDDQEINRQILRKMLSSEYELLEAENGKAALDILSSSSESISAVLLDLIMPEMDGYEMLARVRRNREFSSLPVIVTTGSTEEGAEMKALSLGANDFITKPYNSEIIKHRLWNTINLRETAAMVNAAERDDLTGLYNRRTFFRRAAEMIAEKEPGYYIMTCFDVDNFKVINDQYGTSKGDQLLCYIAEIFSGGFEPVGGICGRIMADHFAVLYPRSFAETKDLAEIRRSAAILDGSILPITFSIGRYLVDDTSLSASAMYDRASLAQASIKGRYDINIAQYDESMRESLLQEQHIVTEMHAALEDGQFEAWLQPQYNHATGALVGAEALVRWRHPQRGGLIPPDEFVPVFERNGFIYEVDKYVWEQACILLRKWMTEKCAVLPISVNISRYDIFAEDFYDTITGLVKKYDIPVELLHLEVTESAFAKSTEQIVSMVKRLVEYGFEVEIDDFGSGYSSLNTLKDVPATILKLDMKFLENKGHSSRGGNIVESVVRMAKWLGMSVIAEGVETLEQADYLQSIGCSYVQGYLYSKPIPVGEYEVLLKNVHKEEKRIRLETVDNLDNNTFWDPESMETLIFNSYIGGACIFEYHNGNVEVLRANDKYAQVLGGGSGFTLEDALKISWAEHLDKESRPTMHAAIERTIASKEEVTCEATFIDLPCCASAVYLRTSLRAIASTGDHHLIYCTNENVTAQREAEKKERQLAGQMQAIMDNVFNGITAAILYSNEDIEIVFVNNRFFEIMGYTREQYRQEVQSAFDLIHPDDVDWVVTAAEAVNRTGKPITMEYRILRRDGQEIWIRDSISLIRFEGIDHPVQLSIYSDITEEKRGKQNIEQINRLIDDSSAAIYVCEAATYDLLYVNQNAARMCGKTVEDARGKTCYAYLKGADRPCEPCYMETSVATAYTEREYSSPASGKHYMTRGKLIDWGGKQALVEYLTDETERINAQRSQQDLLNRLPGGVGVYNVYPDGKVEQCYLNDGYYALVGSDREERQSFSGFSVLGAVHPDDIKSMMSEVKAGLRESRIISVDIRVLDGEGNYKWLNIKASIAARTAAYCTLYASYSDIDQLKTAQLRLEAGQLRR